MYSIEEVRKVDPEIAAAIEQEVQRQNDHIELIASENWTSKAVMAAMGSPLTNKYAEGYSGKRYYGGCQVIDIVETIAIERAKELFGCTYANVQPHSGASANLAVEFAILKPGDTLMGMNLNQGGHLTHGSPANISGTYQSASWQVREITSSCCSLVKSMNLTAYPDTRIVKLAYSGFSGCSIASMSFSLPNTLTLR